MIVLNTHKDVPLRSCYKSDYWAYIVNITISVSSEPNAQVGNRTGPIVGGAVGAIVCLILLAIIILVAILLFKRHQSQEGKGMLSAA